MAAKALGKLGAMLNIPAKFKALKKSVRLKRALKEIDDRSASLGGARTHGLPKPLIVSLTSYPGRFDTLALTLKSILFQTVRPDTTILWVSHEDYPLVPENVLELRGHGLEIATCTDMRAYTKIIPTLQNHKDCFVITVDDDVYYRADCVEKLTVAYNPSKRHVICHRAHRIAVTGNGDPAPYVDWRRDIAPAATSPLIFPTGVMGVLYPPDAFHEDVCNVALFSELSPSADDVWLYWMWRMNGHVGEKLPGKAKIIDWPGSQTTSLQAENLIGGANDRCIQNMVRKYGFPRSS
ncbi:hypothetical protein GGQ99_000141 [Aminobacter niigataensis]|uniref:Glycosyltransferase family 2 protein n=1 Tax=Aminobacter niigataensis TaxID=83265 RepID=A0ABR6KWW7_9HYPH|nr:hypothetical protein [Aminobacter niigataensis]MBB4648419.1 hypothetical protein [Aminobacter niigataensis]